MSEDARQKGGDARKIGEFFDENKNRKTMKKNKRRPVARTSTAFAENWENRKDAVIFSADDGPRDPA